MPDTNFTASEVTSVTNWINNGGGLLALGDTYNWDGSKNLNYLLSSTGLSLIDDTGTSPLTTSFEHPTEEGCSSLSMAAGGLINYTGNAYPLWGNSPTDICIGGEEYGNGRVILTSDTNLFDNSRIILTDNLQYAINIANWLTASQAKVLLYVDEPDSSNYYVTPVSNALNELGINFYLTFDDEYMNLSLNLYDWELVIVDNPWFAFGHSIFSTINDYVKGGDRLIMSTFRVNYLITHPLWARLGFAYDTLQPDSSSLYIWDTAHAIFNIPVDYGATRFDPIRDYGDEGDLLRVYPNATSLAGYTASETENNTNLVLANGGKTLFNGYLIDQFTGDLDDSTYADNFELWVNEIAYMLKPGSFSLSSDADNPDSNGMFNLTWTVSSDATEYNIYQHTSFITELTGAETLIAGGVTANNYPITGLTNGTYYFIIESTNTYGTTLSNCIEIIVEIPPTPPTPPGPGPSPGIPGYEIISLISTMLITTGVLTLVLFKKNKLRK